jgi:hypothetical protein
MKFNVQISSVGKYNQRISRRSFSLSLINNAAEYFGNKNTTKIVKDPALNSENNKY